MQSVDERPALLELFAGGGGTTTGAAAAGFDVFAVEWDASACAVHGAMLDSPVWCGDVRAVADYLPALVAWLRGRKLYVWASPPCQAWSSAGKYPTGSLFRPWWRTVRDALGGGGYLRTEQTGAVARTADAPAPTTGTRGTMYVYDGDPGARVSGSRVASNPVTEVCDAPNRPAWREDEPAGTVRATRGAQYIAALDAPCTTVTATEGRGCATDTRRASRTIGRRITPDEAALLQGWPEVIPHLSAAPTVEDRYRIVGNAVPPLLARAVLSRLA